MKARRGGCLVLPFLKPGTRWGRVVNTTPQPLYPWERDPVPIVQRAGWASGMIWMGAKNLTPSIQPVVSHYTNYTIPAIEICSVALYNFINCK